MNSRLSPVWAAILSLVLAVPAVAGQGIVTIYGVTSNGGSPPTYTCNVSSSAGITVGDHVMAKTTSAGATGVWLVTAKPSATSVTIQDSLTQETGTAFGAPLANVTNGLAYGTPESGTSMIPDGASWWAAAARRNYVVLAEAAPSGAALTRVDDTNITLTLGGTPSTALLQSTSLTLGWTGTLAESRGGTGAASLSAGLDAAFGSTRGSILYRGASGWVVLTPGTSGHALVSNGTGADPSYQAVTTPTPDLATVLGVGADGGAIDQTNLGSQALASGETVTFTASTASQGVRLNRSGTGTLQFLRGNGTSDTINLVSGAGLQLSTGTGGALALTSHTSSSFTTVTSQTFRTTSGVILLDADFGVGSGNVGVQIAPFLEAAETVTVNTPPADTGRLYFRDNGSGTTQLVTKMPGGTAIVLATDGVSAPTLAQVLAAGSNGNAVDQTNLGSLTTAAGETVTSPTVLASTALVVGSADTSGVRMDLSSGNVEFREGDDSGYTGINCGGVFISAGSLNLNGAANIAGFNLLTEAKTSDATLASTQSGRIQTNEGAAGAVNLTLPTATATSGYLIEAVVQANQYLRFTAATGDTIRDGATVSAAAGYIRSTTVGSTIRLYCINATEWIVLSKTGTWTVDS